MQQLYLRNMENREMELNSNQIQEINPHRYPFALVDRITDYKPGEYEVEVQVEGTDSRVQYLSKTKKVKIRVVEK